MRLAGYYTLASASIPAAELPADLARRLPRYPSLTAVRIGRLAVDTKFRGQGMGKTLLWVPPSEPCAPNRRIDAKDDAAVAFYRHLGFELFQTAPRILFLPLATAAHAIVKFSRSI